MEFNPNDIGIANGNYFGLPYRAEESFINIIPVEWDVTTSYSDGASEGPSAIMDASLQVDLFDQNCPEAWKVGIGTLSPDPEITALNPEARKIAEKVISMLSEGVSGEEVRELCSQVNAASEKVNERVFSAVRRVLEEGKVPAVLGGDHSVPFGAVKAVAEKYGRIGILHIDAHADLRNAYEGFEYSHASIMYNILEKIEGTSLVQVAVRDFCADEYRIMREDSRVRSFTESDICDAEFSGETWRSVCDRIIDSLPENVYISFDIDGLSPEYCPSTGTPVPGGLSFSKADYLLRRLAVSGRRIVGFDLCEVAPGENGEWDANVGARMLFKLCVYTWLNASGK